MKKNHLLTLIFLLSVFVLNAQTTKKVLFLGNSYTYYFDMPVIVEQLALSNGDTLIHDKNTPGGHKLIEHAANAISLNKIQSNNWDHVVLQDHSLRPAYYPLEHYNGAEQLLQLINSNGTCLNKAIFYMTWGRESSSNYPYYTHQQLTTDGYNATANIFDTEVSPVGVAWKKVRDDGDPVDLYDTDGSHQSYAGSYLSACVFYATIFDKSPVGLSYTGSLSASDAAYLQQKAFEAYNEYVALGLIHTGASPDTATDVYRAKLNNTEPQLNNLIANDSLNTTFDFTYTGFSTQTNINTTLEYVISQNGAPVTNGSAPISMTVSSNQCVNQTATYPLNMGLMNVADGTFNLDISLNGHLIAVYTLSKSATIFSLAGTSWKLAPIAEALGVGPTLGDFSWWSNTTADVTTRACLFDDQYIFDANGTFRNVLDGNTWLEAWQGVTADGCGTPVSPHDGMVQAAWSYDANTGTITITGTGAYLGLPKVHNSGELTAPNNAVNSITYPVVFNGNSMIVDIDFGGGFWHFVFEGITTSTNNQIEEVNLFSFFPNPASTQIQIQSEEQIDELTIYDMTGKILLTKQMLSLNETIDVSNLSKGLYLLQARIGNQVSVKKLSVH